MRTHHLLSTATAISCLALSAAAGATVSGTADRNGDDVPDRWERKHHLTLVTGQGAKDQDGDGLSNWAEWRAGTNPRRRDSDRDGRPDGREDRDRDGLGNRFEARTGHDPRDPDTNDDGTKDGREGAGRISAIKGLLVTVDLGGGRRLKARLSEGAIQDCATAEDWLAGPPAQEADGLLGEDGARGPADDAQDTVEDLLPSLRTVGDDDDAEDRSGDDGAESAADAADDAGGADAGTDADDGDAAGDAARDQAEDTAERGSGGADDAQPAEVAACPDGVVRRGTWLHGSEAERGQLTWLGVVLND